MHKGSASCSLIRIAPPPPPPPGVTHDLCLPHNSISSLSCTASGSREHRGVCECVLAAIRRGSTPRHAKHGKGMHQTWPEHPWSIAELQAGPLTRVNLPRADGTDTGLHRGYGFAQYTTVVSAAKRSCRMP